MSIHSEPVPVVAVVIPALNEEKSLPLVLGDIPRDVVRDVIVVDNGSADRTAEVARSHGATVVAEPERGYGTPVCAGSIHSHAVPKARPTSSFSSTPTTAITPRSCRCC